MCPAWIGSVERILFEISKDVKRFGLMASLENVMCGDPGTQSPMIFSSASGSVEYLTYNPSNCQTFKWPSIKWNNQ